MNRATLFLPYAELGFQLVPFHWPLSHNRCSCPDRDKCGSPGKHPLVREWKLIATNDAPTIISWFKIWPDCNIAVKCGVDSNLFVVDIDQGKGGLESWENLCKKYNYPNPAQANPAFTPVSGTGSGGYHIFYRHPGTTIKNKVNIAPGIDIRGDNGLAVLPPSNHIAGFYEWAGNGEMSPSIVEMTTAPDWLIAFISSQSLHADERERVNIVNSMAGVAKGERDDMIWRTACKLRHEDWPIEMARDIIQKAAENCNPPFDKKIAVDKVERAYREYQASKEWRNPFDRRVIAVPTDEWHKPVSFTRRKLPPFPTDVFPLGLKNFIEATAHDKQTPTDIPGMCVLSTLAAACAKKMRVTIKESWHEPVNLYTLTVAEPGGGKSPVFDAVLEPLRDYEMAMQEVDAPLVASDAIRRDIKERRLQSILKQAAKDGKDEVRLEADKLKTELSIEKPKVTPKLLVDDITPEKLAADLAEQNGRIAILSAEGGMFEMIAGLYNNGNPKLDIYLKAHSGTDWFRADRIGRASDFIPRPALTIGLTVQPGVLRDLLSKPGLKERGLLARFLYAMPEDMRGKRQFNSEAVSQAVSDHYKQIIFKLLSLPFSSETKNQEHEISLLEDTKKVLEKFADWVEKSRAKGQPLESISEWSAKLVGHVARIAALLHIASIYNESHIFKVPMTPDTMDSACKLGRYLIEHALEAHDEMSRNEIYDDARQIVDWLGATKKTYVLKQNIAGRLKKTGYALERVLTMLQDYGYMRPIERPNNVRITRYEVNPYVYNRDDFSKFSESSGENTSPPANASSTAIP